MGEKQQERKSLTVSILSLSLLTVMAGAAVAPALDVIRAYFSEVNEIFVQMVISIPALFIALANLIFPWLCRRFRARDLVLAGLALYTVAGCGAGAFDHIGLVLFCRALVGVGVGIIMPLSTGLLAYYYDRERQDSLMGYSSAMNQMGGVIATLLSGLLATVSWRASFLVYLMGLFSIVLCLCFLPNERIGGDAPQRQRQAGGTLRRYFRYVGAMFLLMFTFFIYPSAFAMETARTGDLPMQYVGVVMASMDFVAFLGGLSFVHLKRRMGNRVRLCAPLCFLAGYLVLAGAHGVAWIVAGSWLVGFANGLGIPYLISAAARQAGRLAGVTVIPLLSMALYLAQFLTPVLLSGVTALCGGLALRHLPYAAAAVAAALLVLWSALWLRERDA